MSNPQRIVVLCVIAGVAVGGYFLYNNFYDADTDVTTVDDYESCVKAEGSFVLRTYPGQCKTNDGKFFDQEIPEDMVLDTSGWKIYENKEIGLSFRYPPDWVDRELMHYEIEGGYYIFKIISPLHQAVNEEFNSKGVDTESSDDFSLRMSYWDSINKFHGENSGYRTYDGLLYSDLREYMSSEGALREKLGELEIESAEAYEVAKRINYAVLLETKKGIIELEFGNVWPKRKYITNEINTIVNSIKIL